MDDDARKILAHLANLAPGDGLSFHALSDRALLRFGDVRELVGHLEEHGLVDVDGPGLSDTVRIIWSGRHVLKAAIAGTGGVLVNGGFVQIGSGNTQSLAGAEDEDEDDDQEEEDDDEDDQEEEDDDGEESYGE